ISYKAESHRRSVYIYAKVEGVMLNGSGNQGVDSIFVFLDLDDNPDTGYQVANLGSDQLVEIRGWNNSVQHSILYEFLEDTNRDNWNSFRRIGGVTSAVGYREVEMNIGVNGARDPKAYIIVSDNFGNLDLAETIISPNKDILSVVQTTIAPEVAPTSQAVHFLRLDLDTRNGGAHVSLINVTRSGDVPDSLIEVNLGIDTDSDDMPDQLISSARFYQGVAALEVDLEVIGRMTLIATAVFTGPDPSATIGLSVSGIESNATVSLLDDFVTKVYTDIAPQITIDGAFGDWTSVQRQSDIDNDVVMRQTTAWINENVDLRSYAVNIGTNAFFYVDVDGRMMGGADIPTLRKRPTTLPEVVDSDRDSVPDAFDRFPLDFNNDAIPDAQTGNDYDKDDFFDFPVGNDYWLNTTIPSDFPAEYANTAVSIYIGPLIVPELMGVDVLSIFLDADNDTATGLPLIVDTQTYGMDYLLAVSGRNGVPHHRGLY
ncbi:MAG: hypothetical protein KAW09_05325, partial [Thermoplasmata archaeon]|nr:hypothetical protein [Thermoplasmata archaeon]